MFLSKAKDKNSCVALSCSRLACVCDAVMRRQQQQQQRQQQQQQQQHQQMLSSAAVDFGEMTSMDIVDFATVDGDELVPSLQVSDLRDLTLTLTQ